MACHDHGAGEFADCDVDREYLAYARIFDGRASSFVYFKDDIWSTMALHHFTDMLRAVFQNTPLKLTTPASEAPASGDRQDNRLPGQLVEGVRQYRSSALLRRESTVIWSRRGDGGRILAGEKPIKRSSR